MKNERKNKTNMILNMIDYLYFGVLPSDYMEALSSMLDELNAKKQLVKENQLHKLSDKINVTINGITFEILPNGASGYAFILHNDEFEIKLMQTELIGSNFYPIKVRIKSESLWSRNPIVAYCYICNWIEETFGEIKANKISRMDLCCHTDILAFDQINLTDFKGNFKKNNIHICNRKINGFDFGVRGSMIFCRIYDKVLEVNEKRAKKWFYDVWQKNDWNQERVWNVEFELKRDFFIEFGIDSVEDAFERLQTIWSHCTENWLVLTDNNRTRIENSSVRIEWQAIAAVFGHFQSMPLVKREVQLKAEADALLPSVLGNITTLAARMKLKNIDRVTTEIKILGEDYLEKKDTSFSQVIQEKIDLIEDKKGG